MRLEVFRPITILDIIVIVLSIFGRETFQNPQRVFHIVMEVSTNEIVKSFDSIVKDFHIVNGSENVKFSKIFKTI